MVRRGETKERSVSKEIGLDDKRVNEIVHFLSPLVADIHTLYVKTLNCHWNMEDARFYFLHKLLEEQYEQLEEEIDLVAERIRKIGRKAPASLQEFLELRRLGDIGHNLTADSMLQALNQSHDEVIRTLRENIEKADKLGDAGTADMLTQLIRSFEKRAWVLRSHLHS